MDMWQDAVPYPVVEATAGVGGQREPVSGGPKPGAGALLGTPGSFPQLGGVMLTMISHAGGLHRGLTLGRQVTFSLWLSSDGAARTGPLPPSPAPQVPAALPASVSLPALWETAYL